MSEQTVQKKPELTVKQKMIAVVVAIVICVVGFPFYWGFSQGPDHTVDQMFTACMVAGALENASGKDAGVPIAHLCASKATAEEIAVRVGLLVMSVVGKDGYEYDIVKTEKNGDNAVVTVKLYDGNKAVTADFKLNKVKNGNPVEEILGRWVLVGVERGK